MPRLVRLVRPALAAALLAALVLGALKVGPRWFPQYARPLGDLAYAGLRVPEALADLPVVVRDGGDPNGPVALFVSGNAGWWSIDDAIVARFADAGVTTIGLNSLGYFVGGRRPEEVAVALERMAATVGATRPLILAGYSFGADIAATVFARLSPATRARIELVSLVGLSQRADYAIGLWKAVTPHEATVPAVAAIAGPRVQCIAGAEERARSACGSLDPARVEIVTLPGGHHFDGNYVAVAEHILAGLTRMVAAR